MALSSTLDTQAPAHEAQPSGVVGPNAVLQLYAALETAYGADAAAQLFRRTGHADLLENPPEAMIDERAPAALLRGLWSGMAAGEAARIARDAGRRTGGYILAHRIPKPVQWLLRALPARLAGAVLLKAIARHSWTFAGSGVCTIEQGRPMVLEIAANPLATPGCVWHLGVLERLFQALASPRAQVVHTDCVREGAPACRFEIDVSPPQDAADEERARHGR